MRCPWCEKYIEFYLRTNEDVALEEREFESARLKGGYWVSINEAQCEEVLANENLDIETAFELGRHITTNLESGETFSSKYRFFSLAEVRDGALNMESKHFWIQSGGCSISHLTPICCELANCSSPEEALELEIQEAEFKDLWRLTEVVKKELNEE